MDKIDIKKTQWIISRIVKSYKIRNEYMRRREDALIQFEQNSDLKALATKLEPILKGEEKLLSILMKEEKEGENSLLIALEILKSSRYQIHKAEHSSKFFEILKKHGLRYEDFIAMIDDGIKFVEITEKDLKEIKGRMDIEFLFIENPDKNLKAFLKQWKKEIADNIKLANHVSKLFGNKRALLRYTLIANIGWLSWGGSISASIANKMAESGVDPGMADNLPAMLVGALFAVGIVSFLAVIRGSLKLEIEQSIEIDKVLKTRGLETIWWKNFWKDFRN